MDYALPLQTVASKASTESLDKVQNQAIKLFCGGMRTTQIAACEIDTNIETYTEREPCLIELSNTEDLKQTNLIECSLTPGPRDQTKDYRKTLPWI